MGTLLLLLFGQDLNLPAELHPYFALGLCCFALGIFLIVLQVGIPTYRLGQRATQAFLQKHLAKPTAKITVFNRNARLFAIENRKVRTEEQAAKAYADAEAIWMEPNLPKAITARAFNAMNGIARKHPHLLGML